MFYDNAKRNYSWLDKLRDKASITADMAVWYCIALWTLFITLPSLDKAITLSDGTKVYPSRGTPGSCYTTSDGQHYVRTGYGVRKIGKVLGAKLIARSIKIRRDAIMLRAAFAITLLAAALTLANIALSFS
jgi:hypothetical protein